MKTPIEQILFRASSVGLLVTGLTGYKGLSEEQKAEKSEIEKLRDTPEGLTEKQHFTLEGWNVTLEDGGTLTEKQQQTKKDYERKLITPKPLSKSKLQRLEQLKYLETKEPELSQGAKSYVKKIWLENEKGYKEQISSKEIRKGIQGEEDSIKLISIVDNIYYKKNKTRITTGNLTGECDVFAEYEIDGDNVKVIHDVKSSWSPLTFMNAEMSSIYEWQGHAYMYLYDANIFQLRYCLVNCPPSVLEDEKKKYCFENGIIDESFPEYVELMKQFYRNYIYDGPQSEGLYTCEERVKTFTFERDEKKEAILLQAIKLAVEFYKTITLNML